MDPKQPFHTILTWSVEAKSCLAPPRITLERTLPPELDIVPLSGQTSRDDVIKTTIFALKAQVQGEAKRTLATVTVTVTGDPGFITVSYGKHLTADDITKFNQQWMQPLERAAALNFATSTLSNLDSSGDTGNGERMAAMVRMFDLTQDPRYLDHLLDLIEIVMHFRDDRPFDTGSNVFRPTDEIRNRVGLPAWGGGLLDNFGLHSVLELTSSLYAYPIAAFARILAEDPALRARYQCPIGFQGPPLLQAAIVVKPCADAVWLTNRVIETVAFFLPQIHQQPVGNVTEAMLTHPKAYLVRPTKADCDDALNQAKSIAPESIDRWNEEHLDCLESRNAAGQPMAHNKNLAFSMALIELSRVLDSLFYLQSPGRASNAEAIRDSLFVIMPRQQRYFVDHLNPESLKDNYDACKTHFCWYYMDAGNPPPPGWPACELGGYKCLNYHIEDTDHGSMDMAYVGLFLRDIDRLRAGAAPFNEQFPLGPALLQGFAGTFVDTIAPNTNVTGGNFKSDLAGHQSSNPPDGSDNLCDGWLELTRVDFQVWALCHEMSLRIVNSQQPYLRIGNHSMLLNSKQFMQ
jgi:hypothetical protein